MDRNWNLLAKSALCFFGIPYKIPRVEPEEKSEVIEERKLNCIGINNKLAPCDPNKVVFNYSSICIP